MLTTALSLTKWPQLPVLALLLFKHYQNGCSCEQQSSAAVPHPSRLLHLHATQGSSVLCGNQNNPNFLECRLNLSLLFLTLSTEEGSASLVLRAD